MTRTARAYAQALYTLAREENLQSAILGQLTALRQALAAEPGYLRLLSAPNLPKAERRALLYEGFGGKLHPYVLSFLKLLTEKGHIRFFSDCCRAYRALYNAEQGIVTVRAVTAVALTDAQRERLKSKLEAATGKRVELEAQVDPAVLGGVRLDYEGKRVDGTVASRLEALGSLLKNTVL